MTHDTKNLINKIYIYFSSSVLTLRQKLCSCHTPAIWTAAVVLGTPVILGQQPWHLWPPGHMDSSPDTCDTRDTWTATVTFVAPGTHGQQPWHLWHPGHSNRCRIMTFIQLGQQLWQLWHPWQSDRNCGTSDTQTAALITRTFSKSALKFPSLKILLSLW